MYRGHRIAMVIPALNEAQAIGRVLQSLPGWVDRVIVADNGSTDQTVSIARDGGAEVTHEPRRGYGAACLAGLAALAAGITPDIVVFMDADHSDDPGDLPHLLDPIADDRLDMVIGSRALGEAEARSLNAPQRFGNVLASWLIRRLWGVSCTDLGPFRAIRYNTLARLCMDDLGFGWTVQMQARAAVTGCRMAEVPVHYRRRIGKSKISGTVRGLVGAGTKIFATIAREYFRKPPHNTTRQRIILFSRLPEPGRTKTRLIPALGPEGAADLQRQMTRHTLATVQDTCHREGYDVEVRHTADQPEKMSDLFGTGQRYTHQGQGDLGDRMVRAFDDAAAQGFAKALCIGSDCPSITQAIFREAFDRLDESDLVLGPATDGGYYLIAMKQPRPELFRDIDWGTASVLSQTRQRAAELGLRVYLLDELSDIDEPQDLSLWDDLQDKSVSTRPWLSVVIPTLNEEAYLAQAIHSARQCPDVEIIVVDGGSTDRTCEIAESLGAHVVQCEAMRGKQLTAGASAANADILLFLHADTRLPFSYWLEVDRITRQTGTAAGAFQMALNRTGGSLRLVEWGTRLRSVWRQLPYGDQAIFLHRNTLPEVGGFKPLPVMEDFDLVYRLRRVGRVRVSDLPTITSARKCMAHGTWRTVLMHQWMIGSWRWRNRSKKKVEVNACDAETSR